MRPSSRPMYNVTQLSAYPLLTHASVASCSKSLMSYAKAYHSKVKDVP